MRVTIKESSTVLRLWYARHSRTGRLALWLGTVLVFAMLSRSLPGSHGFATFLTVLCCLLLSPLLLVLLYRWSSRRMLWKVRNRLILTYLLMGLAPVVLFGSLGLIAIYLLAGQYSASTVLSNLDQAETNVTYGTLGGAAWTLTRETQHQAPYDPESRIKHLAIAVQQGSQWRSLDTAAQSMTLDGTPLEKLSAPGWMHAPFQGVIASNGKLYLCSEQVLQFGSRSAVAIGLQQVNPVSLDAIAHELGRLTIFPGFTRTVETEPEINEANISAKDNFHSMQGGAVPPAGRFFDPPIYFSSPVHVVSWDTGESVPTLMVVLSRPSLLYKRLFSTSVNIGVAVRTALVTIAALFSVFELLALLMAVRLSHTITRSVDDLYQGTREIDAGHLDYRIRVARHDQLAALASSFNGMAKSIGDLLRRQQKEERLRNELAIAQEVQMTLFPQSPASLRGLEMHAVCRPALIVGGDYFDFIFGPRNSLYLAFGDISGKGVSAALLMASLHSAVRAFCLGDDSLQSPVVSPALLLKLINRHLYCSTQSARYATLFLATYNEERRELTYSNGGHLPPMILSSDGRVTKLDCGGAVVGLLEHAEYREETVRLRAGDLVVAFTDGLTEPENGPNEFGEQRLIETIQLSHHKSLQHIVSDTLQAVQNWIGEQEQPDDMTMLLARQL